MAKDASKKKSKKVAVGEVVPEASTSTAAASTTGSEPSASKKQKKDKKQSKGKAAVETTTTAVEDQDLDDLFKTAATFALPKPEPAPIAIRVPQTFLPSQQAQPTSKTAKRKRDESKLVKPTPGAVANDEDLSELDDDDEADEDLEEAYEKKIAALLGSDAEEDEAAPAVAPKAKLSLEDVLGDVLDGEDGPEDLVHETVVAAAKAAADKKPVKEKKNKKTPIYVPEGETQEQRDSRTLFIGNLSVEVAKDKKLLHQLHAHLLTALPSLAKIESTRFRSAAFANTTEELPAENEEKEAQRSANRARERTRAWREEEERKGVKDDGAAVLDAKKTFMTPEEKKRVAFIKKDFHASADFTNAYIVFAHPHPDRSANVAPLMDPYEAARMAATRVNGTIFNGRTIRVDLVRASASTAETARAKSQLWIAGTDPKKSVFVGNLGLEEKEEGVREFFEKLLTTERGEVPDAVEGEEAYAGDRWVVNVRIIRDKGTGLGKGFAYVATRDRDCVDEILALSEEKLRYNKRKLRVQRCKTLPSKPKTGLADAATAASSSNTPASSSKHGSSTPSAGPLPKGNPHLGEQIKDLSKDDRKVAKAADADRLARRMAKKKARVTMDKQGGPASKRESVKLGSFGGKNAKGKTDLKAKKSRTRSEHAATNRNKKKA